MNYGQAKTPKSEKINIKSFKIHRRHVDSENEIELYQKHDFIQSVSVDPGYRNYAFYIERRYRNGLIQTLVLVNTSIDYVESEYEMNLYIKLEEFLDRYIELYKQSHFFIVEKQMPQNVKSLRIAQHTLSYFMNVSKKLKHSSYIIEIDSKLKSRAFGIKNFTRKDLKEWGIEKADQLLRRRRDDFALNILSNWKKKIDDMTDTIIQTEAFFKTLIESFNIDNIQLTKKLNERRYNKLFQDIEEIVELSSEDISEDSI